MYKHNKKMNSEKIKAQRLKYCRFYKGEDECPFKPYNTNDKEVLDKNLFGGKSGITLKDLETNCTVTKSI